MRLSVLVPHKLIGKDIFQKIIIAQQINGSWLLMDIATILSKSVASLKSEIPSEIMKQIPDEKTATTLWATLFALAFLKQYHSDKKSSWALIEGKAKSWVSSLKIKTTEAEAAIETYMKKFKP